MTLLFLNMFNLQSPDILSILHTLPLVHLSSPYPYFDTNLAGGVLAQHNMLRTCQQMFFIGYFHNMTATVVFF